MYLCIGQIKDDHLKTMNQAENAIEEDFDDYAYDSNYDLYDSLDCEDVRDTTDPRVSFNATSCPVYTP